MADTTNHYGLPFPEGEDGVVVHTDIERLAKRVDYAVSAETQAYAQQVQDTYGHLPDDVAEHERKLEPVVPTPDDTFRIRDQAGQVAFGVNNDGSVSMAGVEYIARSQGLRVLDQAGQVAFEVTPHGRTHIYDLDTEGGSSNREIHVFLAVGQSNMQGFARPFGGDLDPIDYRILQYGANKRLIEPATVPLDNPGGSIGLSPATTFARHYLRTQPDNVTVLLVPAAWAGTGFNNGSATGATWDDRQVTDGIYDLYNESVQQTLEALDQAGESAELKGILWHQGESDQWSDFETYASQLDRLIDNYRSAFNDPELPFVIGQMTQEGFDVTPQKRVIDAVHQDTLQRQRHTGFAPSQYGGTNYNDTTHFGRIGVETLGEAYVYAYYRALDNAPGFGPQQPQNVRAEFINGVLSVRWDQQPRRVTEYKVAYRTDGGAWTEVVREYPMNLSETVTGLTGSAAEIAVTAVNLEQETPIFQPVIVPHIQW